VAKVNARGRRRAKRTPRRFAEGVLTTSSTGFYSCAMGAPRQITDLEIVGYATVLKDTMAPSVVPPVFCVKAEPSRILFPPYTFSGGFVWNAAAGNEHDLRKLADDGEITQFAEAFPSQPDFDLWVDQGMVPHYEPRAGSRKPCPASPRTASGRRGELSLKATMPGRTVSVGSPSPPMTASSKHWPSRGRSVGKGGIQPASASWPSSPRFAAGG